ncbi:hypothetical protein PFTANZ_00931 [Plasmodium falciparum Tanzania (2000708)]|uniref:Uncharacterized protein n=1 Tax=Plasmodium falciparum Tanzania (2000708) TaxID=1036725 RepID=A0A024WCK9_PLAFA|nr:hypothetical protein PFTANZ_00931 [Plasmodium falciparum Tanzania (2000708)]
MVTHFYILTSLGLILHNIMYTITCSRSATFLRKLSASGVEPTFSQGKVTYLTTGLLGQLNNSTIIKYGLKYSHTIFIKSIDKLDQIHLIYDLGRFHPFL